MQRIEKERKVAELKDSLGSAQGAVLTTFQGLSVKKITEIRRSFREKGVTFQVVKNTLARRAIEGTSLGVLGDDFIGPTAIAYSSEDPIAPAKVAAECAKNQEEFSIRCGYLDGERLDENGVARLSKLPGKDELRAKFLNLCMAPATQLVRTFNAVPQQVALLLSAFESKRKEEGEA